MTRFVGVTGSGAIGRDPWHPRCWSGSSAYFFGELRGQGLLDHAVGVEARWPWKQMYGLRNFRPSRRRWMHLFYMDVGYRDALAREIRTALVDTDASAEVMQLGAMYDVVSALRGARRCYSYNDGNFSMAMQSPDFPEGLPKSRIEAALDYERQLNQRLDRVFTMSEYLRRSFIRDYGVPENRVTCIGAGVNISELPPLRAEKNDYDRARLLFIGVDFARKGGHDVLRAFKIVREATPRATLDIVGPPVIPEGVSLPEGVRWHGFLRKNDPQELATLRGLFEQASLFVMPSLYEPFGIAPLEALSYRVPALVTDDWALPETVEHGVCGENVACGDHEQLAAAILGLVNDPDRLKRYGTEGRKRVEERFRWPRVVDRLREAMR